jgi:hypothetical protein
LTPFTSPTTIPLTVSSDCEVSAGVRAPNLLRLRPRDHGRSPPRRPVLLQSLQLRAQRTRVTRAKQAIAALRPDAPPVSGEFMHPGFSVAERVKFAKIFHKTIAHEVGDAVLRAAARLGVGCRWCLALPDARVNRDPVPAYDAVHRELLGEPCDRCKAALRATLDRGIADLRTRVDAGRQSPGRRQTSPRSLAASGHAPHDVDGRCVVCAAWREKHPQSVLTASVYGIPEGCPSHPPWYTSVSDYDAWVAAGRPKRWRWSR